MFEASTILPLAGNAGENLDSVHAALAAELLERFGGFTVQTVFGAWRDESTGAIYRDESREYRVAAEWTERQASQFERIAARHGADAGQVSVYVRHADGFVVFVTPGAAPTLTERASERDAA